MEAMPKILGGWGLKNLPSFENAFAAKLGWRLISTHNLWKTMVYRKYIHHFSLEDFPDKRKPKILVIWKVVLSSF